MARQSLGRASISTIFRPSSVLLLEDQAREVGGVFQLGDDGDVQT
jgi:hypothetical protein